MSRLVKILLAAGALGGLALASLFLFVLVDGARMKVQPHIRSYQRVAPLPPPRTVPSSPSPYPAASVTATAPLPAATRENVAHGKAYYELYCLFCHGADGRGNGPVGESYFPAPSDLTSAAIKAKSSADIHAAMLSGSGHAPVLEKVVPAEQRGLILLYVRTFEPR